MDKVRKCKFGDCSNHSPINRDYCRLHDPFKCHHCRRLSPTITRHQTQQSQQSHQCWDHVNRSMYPYNTISYERSVKNVM